MYAWPFLKFMGAKSSGTDPSILQEWKWSILYRLCKVLQVFLPTECQHSCSCCSIHGMENPKSENRKMKSRTFFTFGRTKKLSVDRSCVRSCVHSIVGIVSLKHENRSLPSHHSLKSSCCHNFRHHLVKWRLQFCQMSMDMCLQC